MRKLNKILLVDDDSTSNFLTQMILEDLQVADAIIVKKNGQEALDYINELCLQHNEDCPELIFLDINMPIMDGFELLDELQRLNKLHNPDSPITVVLLTTSNNPKDIEKAKTYDITYYIEKPLTEDSIRHLLSKTYNV
ncbi:response regulator [Rhodocytophaga aerolata]|uniref:Response regulator n=1 Tax=Rhodocytophaga aerolata TaxID=455078 RepID=A0ABT8QY35_9BACT|nr:response regulator [Rhodocytophaga aerolata]MDO1444753.1 response regulator [Rhodocytophaga aerolata]